MAALINVGADAPRVAALAESGEAPTTVDAVRGFWVQGSADDRDRTRKATATALARLALLGIEAQPLKADAWHLRHARGADIGVVCGIQAVGVAVSAFETACTDVRRMVPRLQSGGAR